MPAASGDQRCFWLTGARDVDVLVRCRVTDEAGWVRDSQPAWTRPERDGIRAPHQGLGLRWRLNPVVGGSIFRRVLTRFGSIRLTFGSSLAQGKNQKDYQTALHKESSPLDHSARVRHRHLAFSSFNS